MTMTIGIREPLRARIVGAVCFVATSLPPCPSSAPWLPAVHANCSPACAKPIGPAYGFLTGVVVGGETVVEVVGFVVEVVFGTVVLEPG